MKKLLLFVFVFLFIISFVSAYTEFAPNIGSMTTGLSDSINYDGEIIHVGPSPFLLQNVTVVAGSNFQRIFVYRDNGGSGVYVANSTIGVDRNASFNVQLNANTNYLIVGGSHGAAWSSFRDSSVQPYPINWSNNIQNSWVNATEIDSSTLTISYFSSFNSIIAIQTNESSLGSLTVNLISPANNTGTFSTSIVFNASLTPVGTNITNATIFVWFSNGTLFNQTRNLLTGNTINYTSWNISNFIIGNYKWNVLGCITNSSCFFATNNLTFSFDGILNSNTFNSTTTPGSVESFTSNVTIPSNLALSTAVMYWNGTAYIGSIGSDGTNNILSRTITIPNGTGVKNWFWSLTFTNGVNFNLTSQVQTVGTLMLDNCSLFTQRLFNFSLFDEDSRSPLNGTIEIIATVYGVQSTTVLTTFNNSYNVTNTGVAGVCINSTNASYSLFYQAKYYGNSSYSVEYKFAQNIIFTNNSLTQVVNLYDLLDARSTPFQIILQNPDLSVIQGAVVDIQRQYIPINSFLSVESPLTDTTGTAIAHLVSRDIYYNFVVSKNGTVLGTFNNQNVQCQNEVTGDCRINLNLALSTGNLPDFTNYGNISVNFLWSPSTRTLEMDFLTVDGNSHLVAWNVTKADNWGNTTICTNSQSAASGSFTCVIPALYGNSSIYADIYSDNVFVGRNGFSLQPTSSDIFGGTKVILGMLMYTTLTLLMIATPITVILGAIIGMGLAVAFHIVDGGTFFGNTSIILYFVIAGGILIYYMRNRS